MLVDYYLWLKAFHLISLIAWMAAMFYLPRLFVYHVDTEQGSIQSETFKVMERRLLRFIGTPAMIATWVFGILLLKANPDLLSMPYFHVKLTLVFLMSAFHGMCAGWMKKFARDANQKSQKFYRYANEVPTVLMIIIVIMVIAQPI